jgi:ABC-type Mn2+/Zn2+ transport system ATPase subunit
MTGLMGAGHDQVPYALFGALEHSDGTITIKNKKYEKEDLNPRKAVSQGVALLPGDRTGASGVLLATLTDNVGMPVLRKYFSGGLLRRNKLKKDVGELLRRFDVNPPVPGIELRKLSGGNQQKALLSKWIQIKPDVLLLHEPTQGVDVGSKAAIFGKIADAARAGAGVIVASAEHEDLANICNRVLIFAEGKVVAELVDRELTPEKIVELSYLGTRKGGGIKRGFVWRPHMNGLKGPYLHVTRNYTWSPHKVGFKTHIEWPAPAKPAVQYEKQEATFVWSPNTVGFVKREYRWFPHTVGMQNTAMPYPGPRIVKVEREYNLIPTGELSSFFVWRPHYVGNNEPVYLGPKDVDKWKTELSASLAAMVARGEITAMVAEKMAKAAGVTLGKSQDLRVTIELDVRTRNKGNVADVDRFKHALLNMDQSLLDVNGVRILGIELQPDKTR